MGEGFLHLLRAFEKGLGIWREQWACIVERGVVAQAGEGIAERACVGAGVFGGVGGDERDVEFLGDADVLALEPFVAAQVAADEFDVEISFAKDAEEAVDGATGERLFFGGEESVQRAVAVAGEANQTGGEFFEFVPEDGAFVFGGAQMDTCEQAAEVLVSGAGADEQRQGAAVFHGYLAADDGADAVGLCRTLGAGGAVEAIAVDDGYGVHAEFGGTGDDVIGLRGTA